MQGGQATFVANFNIDASIQQDRNDAGVSSKRGKKQGRLAGTVGFGNVKALLQQAFGAFDIAIPGGVVKGTGCRGRRP